MVQRYATVLDVDSGTLEGPAYKHGRLLESICDPQRRWLSAETFSAFLYAELHEMAILASLYYYLCCVGTPMDRYDEPLLQSGRVAHNSSGTTFKKSLTSGATQLLEQTQSQFFREHRLSPCDAQIIQHMANVIKEQQAQELYGSRDAQAPIIHLDYAPCERFTDSVVGSFSSFGSLTSFGADPNNPGSATRKKSVPAVIVSSPPPPASKKALFK